MTCGEPNGLPGTLHGTTARCDMPPAAAHSCARKSMPFVNTALLDESTNIQYALSPTRGSPRKNRAKGIECAKKLLSVPTELMRRGTLGAIACHAASTSSSGGSGSWPYWTPNGIDPA